MGDVDFDEFLEQSPHTAVTKNRAGVGRHAGCSRRCSSGSGSHFDPAVVEAFVRVAPAFAALSAQQSAAESIPA